LPVADADETLNLLPALSACSGVGGLRADGRGRSGDSVMVH
jgi:hypothetical protein